VREPADLPVRAAVSVIVPFYRGRQSLERVVSAVSQAPDVAETIVVANGSDEDLSGLAHVPRLRVLDLPAPCGPAVARNRGAAAAAGDILTFIDSDVVPHPDAIARMVEGLTEDNAVAAVFGAYDHSPPHPGFFSQYRNLAHAFIHEQARSDARTFWGGLGAIRASAFRAVHGFDERFTRPSIEDIDLGYRLREAGYALRLDPRIRGTHLRRWTLGSSIVTDIRDRGIPWTQALLKFGALRDDLNVSWSGRLALASACAALGGLLLTPVSRAGVWIALAAAAGFLAAHTRMLRFFVRERGVWFAARVAGGQFVHHLCNGVSLIVGTALWALQRAAGWRTRWTLPSDPWRGASGPIAK
jgi:GT2 family glycosyltransferase